MGQFWSSAGAVYRSLHFRQGRSAHQHIFSVHETWNPGDMRTAYRQGNRRPFEMGKGSTFHIRGPYGRGFPIEQLKGKKLLLIAGGLGLAPLRSLLLYALDRRSDFEDIILMYGTNNPDNVLFKYELLGFYDRDDIKYLYSVDRDDEGIWKQYVGVVTGLFDRATLSPEDTFAVMCGPPIMYRFVLQKLLSLGFPKDHVYMSLERMMKCGVGKCGHCAIGDRYCCIDGPVFPYGEIETIKEAI